MKDLQVNEFENLDALDYLEMDRKRIASELHDTSLQDLTHIIHQIELSSLYIDIDPIKAKLELEDVNNQIRRVIQDIRNTIFNLRPMSFDDLGLSEAIDQYIDFLQKKYAIDIFVHVDDIEYLDIKKKLNIYRIIHECLMNSAKHADANKIELLLKDEKAEIYISIKDDGIGFEKKKNISDENNKHYGLAIVKDRVSYLNGKYSITSDENKGTHIEVRIPNKKGVSYEN